MGEHPYFNESSWVEEQVDALARCQMPAGVVAGDFSGAPLFEG
ncbi:hypothetical protein Rhow_005232 [Rhodococcus wratislaviensis]|uniref:Uncharacterized protein n=1 Tax=Rhodococcus wratislaviensis TaxID=44752 RepID=A0A402CDA0_RHOWR|nr:hypothetical protein Rhow_005232 [Rhodococcus wratislaviensis]